MNYNFEVWFATEQGAWILDGYYELNNLTLMSRWYDVSVKYIDLLSVS